MENVEKGEESVELPYEQQTLDQFFAKGLPSAPKRSNSTGRARFEMNLRGLTDPKPFG